MDDFADARLGEQSLCSPCRQRPPAFRRVHARWEYEGAVADAMRRLKYASDFPTLRALCREARPWLRGLLRRFPSGTPLIPLPSHPSELRERGFHVPGLLLRLVGLGRGDHPVDSRLRKIRPTARQASLPLDARRENVAEVFHFRGESPGGTALVVDDVLTTGATADAASSELLASGFDNVEVVVLARAPLSSRY